MIPASILKSPPKITGQIAAFAASLSTTAPRLVKLVPFPGCDTDCWSNMTGQINRFGGSALPGWRILTWPHLALIAEPHVIWHSPKDELIDITALADRTATALFLADPLVSASSQVVISPLSQDKRLSQWLAAPDPAAFVPLFNQLAQPADPCWCGSGRQWRKCHRQ